MSSVDLSRRSCALFALCLLTGREPLVPLVPSVALHILENTADPSVLTSSTICSDGTGPDRAVGCGFPTLWH
jgi:hypothetical protein